MFNMNDDEDLFPSNVSSNLANLFGSMSTGGAQTDLKYTAPRQPKPVDSKDNAFKAENTKGSEAQRISVICAKVVLASKLVDNACTLVGKLGFAVLGTDQTATELLLYRDRQNIVAKATIDLNFVLHEDEGILVFLDNAGVPWSAKFTNVQDHMDFMKEVMLRNVRTMRAESKHEQKAKPAIPNKAVVKKETEETATEDAHIRADILSRMARMGQSVLPVPKVSETTESDGNDDETSYDPPQKEPKQTRRDADKIVEKPQKSIRDLAKPAPVMHQRQYFDPHTQPYLTSDENGFSSYSQFQMYQNQQASSNQDFRMFMSENRTHNSELRINLGTVSMKLDAVLNEISKLKISPNTDRLENEFLKSKILDLEQQVKSSTSEDLNLQELKRKLAENESLFKTHQEQIKQLNEANRHLEDALNDAGEKLTALDASRRNEQALCREVESLTDQLNGTIERHRETENQLLEFRELHRNLTAENKVLRDLNVKLTGDLNTKGENKENVDVTTVKNAMNEMFQNILADLGEGASISYREVKSALSKHMKHATFNIIDMLEKR